MTSSEKISLSMALDGLWGVCDELESVCQTLIDPSDGRLESAREALCKAQDAIVRLNDLFGIEKHPTE